MNNTKIQIFDSPMFGQLRTVLSKENIVWFCLNDVMKALGLTHITDLRKRLDSKGCDTIAVPTAGGVQRMIFVNEPNLYRCVFQSRKEGAAIYQNWVFEEVLPTIRKTGGYIVAGKDESDEALMARALRVADDAIRRQQQRAEQLEEQNRLQTQEIKKAVPKVQYYDKVLQSESTYVTTQIAKEFGVGASTLNKWLKDKGVQYRQSGQWVLTHIYQNKGYTKTRTHTYTNSTTGEVCTSMLTVWTEKGREFIHGLLNEKTA